ncbi:DUF6531 domain-containing protein [Myxococcota bacterium]|nr:DUF6531 domain-containing protein [Myxococcota bacterium]
MNAAAAEATCSMSTSLHGYGGWRIVRSGTNCDCLFKARLYSCGLSAGYHTEGSEVTLETLPGSCSSRCEDLSGYATAIANVEAKYAATTGAYECESEFVDADGDGFGACIDDDDSNTRIWAKVNAQEVTCDGVDNDADGVPDDGFTSVCDFDHKRVRDPSRTQGDSGARVDIVDGSLLRTELDVTVQGPYGALSLVRTYDSRRNANSPEGLGRGWVHSFGVYLRQLPEPDARYVVDRGDGQREYFYCGSISGDLICESDDHQPSGWLRRVSGVFEYHPGDGTTWTWSSGISDFTTPRLFDAHLDESGHVLADATADTSERPTKIESANTAIYLSFTYGSAGLDAVRISSDSGQQVLDYDVVDQSGGVVLLEKVKYATSLGSIDADTFVAYAYGSTSRNLETVTQKLDSGTTLTTASFEHDSNDRATSLKDATKNLIVDWEAHKPWKTLVTFNVASTEATVVAFTHDGRWVRTRDSDVRMGGMASRTEVRDGHGRVTCSETDDLRMTKLTYSGRVPTRRDVYGKLGDCGSGGTIDRSTWYEWELGRASAWRLVWAREKSIYSPATSCTGTSLPSGCAETRYSYASSTDDRVRTVKRTGSTRLTTASVTQQVRARRFYYFDLDSSTCGTTGAYGALPCRVTTTDDASTPAVYGQTDFTYTTAGHLASTKRYVSSLAGLTTSYASHNAFGAPTTVTSETGMVITYAYNGWNAVTSITETDAMIDAAGTLIDPVTTYAYNKLRRLDAVTLPKGNKEVHLYLTGATDYARPKAFATADSSGGLLEILRYEHDWMGNRTEEKILDSIAGTTPCADADCTTLESRTRHRYDAGRRVLEQYLYASSTSSSDAVTTTSYTNGQVTNVDDYLGVDSLTSYDDQGRIASVTQDDGGLEATTSYTYDAKGRVATITAPNGVVTTKEHDDFGQVVLERSRTRGDIRYEYNPAGYLTKRRTSAYNSTTGTANLCYSVDWLGRKTTVDYLCDGVNVTLRYDGDSM